MLQTLKNSCDFDSLPIGASTVVAGTAAAAYMGNFEPFTATLCLIFMLLLQMFGNLLYRYTLSRKGWGDGLERYMAVQATKNETLKLPDILMAGVTASGILTGMVGLALLSMAKDTMWIVALAVLIAVYIYFTMFGPRPLVRTPMSLITTFIMFGPVGVVSTTYIQATYKAVDPVGWFDLGPALVASIITGLYAIEPQIASDIRSCRYDLRHGKRTLPTLIGTKWSCIVMIVCGVISAILASVNAISHPHLYSWIPIVIFCVAALYNAWVSIKIYRDRDVKHKYSMWKINWICLVSMIVYLIYSLIWGHPDYRYLEFF